MQKDKVIYQKNCEANTKQYKTYQVPILQKIQTVKKQQSGYINEYDYYSHLTKSTSVQKRYNLKHNNQQQYQTQPNKFYIQNISPTNQTKKVFFEETGNLCSTPKYQYKASSSNKILLFNPLKSQRPNAQPNLCFQQQNFHQHTEAINIKRQLIQKQQQVNLLTKKLQDIKYQLQQKQDKLLLFGEFQQLKRKVVNQQNQLQQSKLIHQHDIKLLILMQKKNKELNKQKEHLKRQLQMTYSQINEFQVLTGTFQETIQVLRTQIKKIQQNRQKNNNNNLSTIMEVDSCSVSIVEQYEDNKSKTPFTESYIKITEQVNCYLKNIATLFQLNISSNDTNEKIYHQILNFINESKMLSIRQDYIQILDIFDVNPNENNYHQKLLKQIGNFKTAIKTIIVNNYESLRRNKSYPNITSNKSTFINPNPETINYDKQKQSYLKIVEQITGE